MSAATAAPLAPVEAFSHVTLRANDVDRMVDFYRRIFGYEVLADIPTPDRRIVWGKLGVVALEIIETKGAPAPRAMETPGYSWIALRTRDVAAALEALKANGVTILTDVMAMGPGGPQVLLFQDPEGNTLELNQTADGGSILDFAIRSSAARRDS